MTATVDSIPLIASSIMSKKLASGADAVLLDVKVGCGAFMKTVEDARALAETMTAIGQAAHFPTAALLTNMDAPLGNAVGNSLEVAEAVSVLRGAGPDDLRRISLALAAGMLHLAAPCTFEECHARAEEAIRSGAAFDALCRMTAAQGGDVAVLDNPANFPPAHAHRTVTADTTGYLTRLDAETVGRAAVLLGAGRAEKGSTIDHAAGIVLHKKTGDAVSIGDPLATLYAGSEDRLTAGAERFRAAFAIGKEPPAPAKLIYGYIDAEGWHER